MWLMVAVPSDTPVTVTVWVSSQLPASNVSTQGSAASQVAAATPASSLAGVTVTSAVGWVPTSLTL